MTVSGPLDQELDLRLAVVEVDSVEILHRAGRDVGGVTAMSPEDNSFDSRIRDVAGTFVGWMREPDPVDVGVSGVISVLLGSESASYLSSLAQSRRDVDIVFTSNGSGLGFKTQSVGHAKISASPISIEPNGVRMFMFIGWDYEEVPLVSE